MLTHPVSSKRHYSELISPQQLRHPNFPAHENMTVVTLNCIPKVIRIRWWWDFVKIVLFVLMQPLPKSVQMRAAQKSQLSSQRRRVSRGQRLDPTTQMWVSSLLWGNRDWFFFMGWGVVAGDCWRGAGDRHLNRGLPRVPAWGESAIKYAATNTFIATQPAWDLCQDAEVGKQYWAAVWFLSTPSYFLLGGDFMTGMETASPLILRHSSTERTVLEML